MTVTVGVDAVHLNEASANRGIGTYLRHVLAHLASEPDLDVRALTTDPTALPNGVEPVRVRRRAPDRLRWEEHELRLPRDLERTGAAVVWSPAQDPPRRCRPPFVQTLLDATPLLWPDPATAGVARRMRRLVPRYRAAAAWIAISRASADSCATVMGLPRDRIEVAHLGVDDRFRSSAARSGPGVAPSPYVLYVGEFGPHKGFAEAFAVIGALADAGLPHRLRMVGRIGGPWRRRIEALVAAAPHPQRIDLAGWVDDLPAAYHGADALLVTSRREGFGLPAAEAMACGTPVVAFDNTSLPEVIGDGGALVADGDVDAFVAALRRLLTDRGAWADASARALERSRAFDWDRTGAIHADVLRSVAS